MSFDNFSLASVIAEHGRARRERIAIIDGDYRISYGALAERIDALAQGLVAKGLKPGERLLWLGQNSAAILELLVACARVGATFCAVNWRQSPEELEWTVRDFRPAVIVCQQCEVSAQFQVMREGAAAEIGAAWVDIDSAADLDAIFVESDEALPDANIRAAPYALYTAAFDGRPQAALLSNMAILFQNLILSREQSVDESSVFLNSGPMFHMGTMMTTFAVLHQGGTNVIARRTTAPEVLDLIETEKCTHAFLMPPTLGEMENEQAGRPRDLTSLWPAGTIERPKGILIMPQDAPLYGLGGMYGQSEMCGLITTLARGGGGAGKATLAEVRIVDNDGRDVPEGDVGEIVVRSPLLMDGYFDRDAENAARRPGGWHRSRDLGRRRPDGGIDFIGPKTMLIKSAAENVYPAEVEMCLRQHPAVADVCVIGVPDEVWGQSVKAVIQLKDSQSATDDEIIAHCKERIASYKKPKLVAFVTQLPRAATGFVDRSAVDAAHGGGGYPFSH